MPISNLRSLPRFSDCVSYLYVEHAIIERENHAIAIYQEAGVTSVPAAGLAALVLGPGTRITHGAIVALAECGTTVVWAGAEHQRFYASGIGRARSSANLLRQAKAWAEGADRIEKRVRTLMRDRIAEHALLDRSARDLGRLFDGLGGDLIPETDDDGLLGQLWDPEGTVSGGVNYADDDA